MTDNIEIIERVLQELLNADIDTKEISTQSSKDNILNILKELQQTIRKLKNGKAAAYDQLTSEMLKNMG